VPREGKVMRGGPSPRRPFVESFPLPSPGPVARPAGKGRGRTSLAPRAHGRRRAARVHSHRIHPQGSLVLVLFAAPALVGAGDLSQRRRPPFLQRRLVLVRRRTGEATVPREGKVMRPAPFARPPAAAAEDGRAAPPPNPSPEVSP
jgi:hypothetical protein